MSRSGREAITDVREWSGRPQGFAGVVRGPPGYLGVVGRPSRISGSGRNALPEVLQGS